MTPTAAQVKTVSSVRIFPTAGSAELPFRGVLVKPEQSTARGGRNRARRTGLCGASKETTDAQAAAGESAPGTQFPHTGMQDAGKGVGRG